jgi:hypothetical protein
MSCLDGATSKPPDNCIAKAKLRHNCASLVEGEVGALP